MKKLTLALLYGGISSERAVSLNSGAQVYEALDKEKYDILRYDTKTDLPRLVADAASIDAALLILHGPFGEDGTVQGLLELLDIPYQGAGVLGSAVAMNKLTSKQLYEKAGLPTPAYTVATRGEFPDLKDIVRRFGLPLVVKPVSAGSSVGITIVRSEDMLQKAVDDAFAHDKSILFEEFIRGVELTGGVIGNDDPEAFPLIEIRPRSGHDFFDYDAKYTPGASEEICPAGIDAVLTEKAQTYARMAHQALCCRGYSRTDMILRGRDIFVLDRNTIPGMTGTSLYPQAARAAGLSFTALLDRLIELGIEAHAEKREKRDY